MDAIPTHSNVTTDERYWGPSGQRVGNPVWTKQLKEELIRLATIEKLSAGEIAKRLGFETRNAIIGQLHRLGIKTGLYVNRNINPKEYGLQKRVALKRHRPRIKLVEEPALSNSSTNIEAPEAKPCSLLELTNSTCRWPFHEPATSEFFFCGNTTADLSAGKPYCNHHSRVSRRGPQ